MPSLKNFRHPVFYKLKGFPEGKSVQYLCDFESETVGFFPACRYKAVDRFPFFKISTHIWKERKITANVRQA